MLSRRCSLPQAPSLSIATRVLSAPLLVMLPAALACGPGERFEGTLGGVSVSLDAPGKSLRLESHGRELGRFDLGRVGFAEGEAFYEMQYGMFRIDEAGTKAPVYAERVRLTEAPANGPIRFELLASEAVLATGELAAEAEGHLVLHLSGADPAKDRTYVQMDCAESDHFAGFGAHTQDVDFRGQIVPVWVSEQGIGKTDNNEYPPLWYLLGRRHTTHVAVPATVTSRGSAVALETWAFTRFDVCATDEDSFVLESWEPGATVHVFDGPTTLDAISRLTTFTGRPRVPPPWAFAPWNDGIFGSESVRELARFLRENQIPSSAIWTEDWRGGEWRGDLYRLHADWRLDRDFYPDYEDLVEELLDMGMAHQLYFNTFLTVTGDVYDEAKEEGYAILDRVTGEPFLFDGADADFGQTAMVDLTHEPAKAWMRSFLERALDYGALGWMADYAEWMPIEGVRLASGEDPALVHNRYPVLWAELNDQVIRERGLEGQVNIYNRSAALFSQRYVQILWAGDQRTDFQKDDGLPTILPKGLGAGAVGFPFYAHDIAGYQSSTNPPSTKELFFRWTEIGAFTPVMRTHHGTHAALNWNFRRDEDTLAHWKRYAELHVRLYPYLRSLAHRAVEEGRPLWIAMGLLYPQDAAAWPILDQYFFGDALLVAPVVTEGATSREVYFPEGRFAPLFGGDVREGPGRATVDAPLEEIPVFLRAGGIVPMTAEPAQTLLPNIDGLPGLESTEGDRVVYVGLGDTGAFVEESGASYRLEGRGITLRGLTLDDEGAVVLSGDGVVEGDGFTFTLEGHPATRTTRVFFR